jgi:putative cell wall-binding protein
MHHPPERSAVSGPQPSPARTPIGRTARVYVLGLLAAVLALVTVLPGAPGRANGIETAAATVTVTDGENPVEGARLEVFRVDVETGVATFRTPLTDADGIALVDGLPLGTYIVRSLGTETAPELGAGVGWLTVSAGGPNELLLSTGQVAAPSVRFSFTDGVTGNPVWVRHLVIEIGEVEVIRAAEPLQTLDIPLQPAGYCFSAEIAPAGDAETWTPAATCQQVTTGALPPLAPMPNSVPLWTDFTPGGFVEIEVLDPHGNPAELANVQVIPFDPAEWSRNADTVNGSAFFDLPVGDYFVRATMSSHVGTAWLRVGPGTERAQVVLGENVNPVVDFSLVVVPNTAPPEIPVPVPAIVTSARVFSGGQVVQQFDATTPDGFESFPLIVPPGPTFLMLFLEGHGATTDFDDLIFVSIEVPAFDPTEPYTTQSIEQVLIEEVQLTLTNLPAGIAATDLSVWAPVGADGVEGPEGAAEFTLRYVRPGLQGIAVGRTGSDLPIFFASVDLSATASPQQYEFALVEGSGAPEVDFAPAWTDEDPVTGQVTVAMSRPTLEGVTEPLRLTFDAAVCEAGAEPATVSLRLDIRDYTATPLGDGRYVVEIPADEVVDGILQVNTICPGASLPLSTVVGQIVLYDPSGIITDADTGQPVIGAEVTLYQVPAWTPRLGTEDDRPATCESNVSKLPGQPWSQPAPTDLGVAVDDDSELILPRVNPQVTDEVGYYGWDVAEGCWYVVVSAPGYETLTSPVVGVPPEVIDLDLALTPVSSGGPGGGSGGDGPGGGGGGAPAPDRPRPSRAQGPDRFGTAAAVASRHFEPGVPVVYLATGADFADALAAGAAALGEAPILLVRHGSIPEATAAELERLQPGRIVVLGGPAAVSDDVLEAARAYTDGTVTRLEGADRFATAAAISASAFAPGVPVTYVATGLGFADALAIGPASGGDGPVLLVRPDSIPSATAAELTRLAPQRIVVLGGQNAVSSGVLQELSDFTDGSVTRLQGPDRFATSAAISAATFEPGVPLVYLATGLDFADALAAGPVGAPILLVRERCIPQVVLDELDRLDPESVVILGGTSAVAASVESFTVCS